VSQLSNHNNLGFLEQIKKETSEAIVKIRSNTDAAENQRRMLEEKTKKERYVKLCFNRG
jgi:NAD kinase